MFRTLNAEARKHGTRPTDRFQLSQTSVNILYTIGVCAEKELCVTRFLANLLVFYIVDGLKEDLIIFNVLKLLCKDHVNIHAALK